uniref:MULE transposase domain-containing protein n=1 Tax=Lactuca sativa TaxID=4236 RepID=A0A9R1WM73_LACSA|nr:hypothetical protein LSAT_V11C100044200 [Lactuca sativa]
MIFLKSNQVSFKHNLMSFFEIDGESAAAQPIPSDFFSPNGTSKIWIPENVDDVKPKLYSKYISVDDAINMYKAYAAKAAFDVTKGSTKLNKKSCVLTHRSTLCSRDRLPQSVYVDTTDRKKIKLTKIPILKGKDVQLLRYLEEKGKDWSNESTQNNERIKSRGEHRNRVSTLGIELPWNRRFWNSNRFRWFRFRFRFPKFWNCLMRFWFRLKKLTNRVLVLEPLPAGSGSNILGTGITGSGSGSNFLGTAGSGSGSSSSQIWRGYVVDYKNQSRKVNCFVGKDDAQIVVDKYLNKMKEDQSHTFEFICDKGKLVSLFWANEAPKVKYREFCDVVSFDATFHMNNNHRKSVTFVIGLLSSEITESYLWLFKTFLKTFGRQPTVVLTDEDAAMKIAIERIFHDSRHRLCMWHITRIYYLIYVFLYVLCVELSNDMKFKKHFNKLIWNSMIDASEFDIRWRSFIEDYKIQEITWFLKMFDVRESWILAYLRDMSLSGLMRTTTRQRHNQCFLDHPSNIFKIKSKISLKNMEHATDIYTSEVFINVKKEIEKSSTPKAVNEEDSESDREFLVPEKTFFSRLLMTRRNQVLNALAHFSFNMVYYACIYFSFLGLTKVNKIPSKYILSVILYEVLMKLCSSGEASSSSSSLYDPISQSVSILSKDAEKLKEFFELIKEEKVKVDGVSSTSSYSDSLLKRKDIYEFIEFPLE